MMNRVFLIGNLTNDAELKTTPSGVSVCRFSIGVSRPATQDRERVTDFFECTAWRGTADTIAKYCKKGHKVCVEGSVQTRTYEDNNGSKRKVFDIIVRDVEFLTPKADNNSVNDSVNDSVTEHRKNSLQRSGKPTLQAMDDDSDIPF
jgi:single-strand DNA-binding protein